MELAIEKSELATAISSGESLKSLAERLDTSVHQVRRMLSVYELSVQELRPTIAVRIGQNIERWQNEKVSLKDAASELSISANQLSTALSNLGLTLTTRKPRPRKTPSEITDATNKALELLMTKGGSLRSVIHSAGLKKLEPQIRAELKRRNIDPGIYFYAHRRFYDWVVLPGKPELTPSGDKLLPCHCLNCGVEKNVSYTNLLTSRSQSCNACKSSDPVEVIDLKTGEIYPSIRRAALEIDCLERYQSVRYHLLQHGKFTSGEHTLELRK